MGKARAWYVYIDIINEWVGRVVSLAIVPMVVLIAIEVVLRYFFNKPTTWSWDISIMLMAFITVMGAGYTLLYKGHVSIDVLVTRFSPRVRAIIDLVTSVFFFTGIAVLVWRAIDEAWTSILIRELLPTILEPPLYPIRVATAVGFFLLLLQGISKFRRDLAIARSGEEGVA